MHGFSTLELGCCLAFAWIKSGCLHELRSYLSVEEFSEYSADRFARFDIFCLSIFQITTMSSIDATSLSTISFDQIVEEMAVCSHEQLVSMKEDVREQIKTHAQMWVASLREDPDSENQLTLVNVHDIIINLLGNSKINFSAFLLERYPFLPRMLISEFSCVAVGEAGFHTMVQELTDLFFSIVYPDLFANEREQHQHLLGILSEGAKPFYLKTRKFMFERSSDKLRMWVDMQKEYIEDVSGASISHV